MQKIRDGEKVTLLLWCLDIFTFARSERRQECVECGGVCPQVTVASPPVVGLGPAEGGHRVVNRVVGAAKHTL